MSVSLAHDLAQALDLADPVGLFRRAVGEPDLWQQKVLLSTSRKIFLTCGRMTGKSAVVSIKALHLALTRPGSQILLVAPAQRQSQLLFSSVMAAYRKLTGLDDPEAESKLSVTFSNRSVITAVPGGGEGFKTIRGFSCSAVCIDEAAYCPKEILQAVIPMLAVQNGILCCLTSASWATGWAYDIWKNEADKTWERTRVTCYECSRISAAFLEDTRATIDERAFKTEMMAEWQDPAESLFGGALLEAALSDDISIIRW